MFLSSLSFYKVYFSHVVSKSFVMTSHYEKIVLLYFETVSWRSGWLRMTLNFSSSTSQTGGLQVHVTTPGLFSARD